MLVGPTRPSEKDGILKKDRVIRPSLRKLVGGQFEKTLEVFASLVASVPQRTEWLRFQPPTNTSVRNVSDKQLNARILFSYVGVTCKKVEGSSGAHHVLHRQLGG